MYFSIPFRRNALRRHLSQSFCRREPVRLRRLWFDHLEDRRLLATFVVINTNDSGPGSLRQALLDGNASPDAADTIHFNIAGTGPYTITPLSPLPFITNHTAIIDGWTQPGFSGVPIIEIDGTCANGSCTPDTADDISGSVNGLAGGINGLIRGLVINNFTGRGIEISQSSDMRIEGNYIGTDTSGAIAKPNSIGIAVVHSSNVRIGGTLSLQRNVLSGNSAYGMITRGRGIIVEGNYIGMDASGVVPVPNFHAGIRTEETEQSRIGGTEFGARNVIAGNDRGPGIWIDHGSNNNSILGNYIGVDATGLTSQDNGGNGGVRIDNSNGNLIGGALPAARNIISEEIGVAIRGSSATGNRIEGNYFGVGADGVTFLPLHTAVYLDAGAHDNVIGGRDSGSGNLIQDVWLPGSDYWAAVIIDNDAGAGNAILGNSFLSPDGMGIDIDTSTTSPGVIDPDPDPNPNDHLDADSGPNNAQNSPEIGSVSVNAGNATVSGFLDSVLNTRFRVEFYSNPATTSPSARRGHTFLGFREYTTDTNGIAPFTENLPLVDGTHRLFTATATRLAADGSPLETSEFGAVYAITNSPPSANAGGPYTVVAGGSVTLDASGSSDPDQSHTTLTYHWDLDGDAIYGETGAAATRGNETGIAPAFSAAGLNATTTVTVSLLVTDNGGLTSTASATINVVSVAIQPDPCDPTKKALVVGGTSEGDHIVVTPGNAGGHYQVKINGDSQGEFAAPPGFELGSILVYAGAGDDNVQIAGSIALDAWLYGDAGDDRLKGGAGDDVIVGSSGEDLLVGGSGRDLLIGGTGADRIVGDPDDDILIGGATSFDAQQAALCAIMDEWTSQRTYAERTSNLTGATTGGANGQYYLNAGATNTTVFDDAAADVMTGSSGQDWFFANLDTGIKDKITDLSATEFAEDLDFILSEP